MRLSAVVISRDEGASLRRTVENLDDTLPGGDEIVVVDDGSTDRSVDSLPLRRGRVKLIRGKDLGVARARNLGARNSRGDTIVFCDAHISLKPFWWRPLAELIRQPHVGAAAPTIVNTGEPRTVGHGLRFDGPRLDVRWFRRAPKVPTAVPLLPGCCVAMRRDVLDATGGWDEGTLQRGCVDNEGWLRLWLLGYELLVTADTEVGHLFRRRSPYPVGWPQYLHNRLRLAFIHLKPDRVAKVVGALRNSPRYGDALLLLSSSNAATRRRELLSRRVRDDDWFFDRFGMKW
jgi:glycosyltransferase involved in cell wall biosynthesis